MLLISGFSALSNTTNVTERYLSFICWFVRSFLFHFYKGPTFQQKFKKKNFSTKFLIFFSYRSTQKITLQLRNEKQLKSNYGAETGNHWVRFHKRFHASILLMPVALYLARFNLFPICKLKFLLLSRPIDGDTNKIQLNAFLRGNLVSFIAKTEWF